MACEAMADQVSNYHVLVEAPTELCPNRFKNFTYLTELDKETKFPVDHWDKFDKINNGVWNIKQVIIHKRQGKQALVKC